MQRLSLRFRLLNRVVLFYLLASQLTVAQVVPDTTLPSNSVVLPNCTTCQITGGTPVGNNLFHSFKQFSIPTGGTAYFNNAATIENIISRVTGKSISNIDGLLSANSANLFLLNPNGIIFGPNASLSIGGSFLATTADNFLFDNDFAFSVSNHQPPPLLTINVPVGLGFGETPGRIVNQSGLLDTDEDPVGLQVPSGKTLALVGGEVALEGGFLTTPGGRIELGSVAGNNSVSLIPINQGWGLDYEGIQNFQDIGLSQAAFIGSSNFRGADVQIQGRHVTLTQGSAVSSIVREGQARSLKVDASKSVELVGTTADLFFTGLFNEVEGSATGEGRTLTINTSRLLVQGGAQVSTTTFSTRRGRGVDLTVNASESVELVGNSPSFDLPSGLFARVGEGATGNGGTLTIDTKRLIVQDGAQVSTNTFGGGRAGDLQVNASKSVELVGRTPDNEASVLSTQVEPGAKGDAGDLTITTGWLDVSRGAQVLAAARSGGRGGTLTINASDAIQLSGTSPFATAAPLDDNRSGVFVSAEPGATRDVGILNITTGLLTVEDGARISADNVGTGQGGTATLNVDQLMIRGGGQVRAGSFGEGPGGTLTVNASESVEVSGNRTIGTTTVPSELFTEAQASGPAGNLSITTRNLSVQNGARVTVSSQGSGLAGELKVAARLTELDKGALTATTRAGNGGDIMLQVQDLLLLRRNSNISTTAGTARAGGNGGDVTIDTDLLVALENSDIAANAFEGRGGNVRITTQGDFRSPDSEITASSERGINGVVEIRRPDVELQNSLTPLSANFVSPEQVVAGSCLARRNVEQGSFTVTGTGGLPRSPYEAISGQFSVAGVQPIQASSSAARGAEVVERAPWKRGDPIQEAQGMVVTADGRTLVGTTPQLVALAKAQNLVCHSK